MTHFVEGSRPYPWPYDGSFVPTRCALVVTGAQRGWVSGSLDADAVSHRIANVGRTLRARGGIVITVLHNRVGPPRRPIRFPPIAHTPDAEPIDLQIESIPITAHGIDGFTSSSLDNFLLAARISTVVFAGFAAEATVDSTLRSANDRGYECITLSDGVAPFDADVETHVLSSITMSGGIFGAIATTANFLALLNTFPVVADTTDPTAPIAQ